jgi:nicotinate-nucleotide adenylyltransferase
VQDKLAKLSKKPPSIGILGGTFDPVHKGHLTLAAIACERFKLDKILFIPSNNPPHKTSDKIASSKDRLNMLETAIDYANINRPIHKFEVSTIEMDRPGKTYSIDTLNQLKEIYGDDCNLYFIIGSDVVMDLITWRNFEEVFKLVKFIAFNRTGFSTDKIKKQIIFLKEKYNAKITLVKHDPIEASSTEIRNELLKVRESGLLENEMLATTYDYIISNNLYGYFDKLIKVITSDLIKCVKKDRYEHTMSVANTAGDLAARCGYNANKARLASMLHDVVKEYPIEKLEAICVIAGRGLDECSRNSSNLLHGPAAAYIIKENYGIISNEISNSIYYHTTGRANMSMLEKIVYVADKIEPLNNFEGIDEVRKVAKQSIDKAMVLLLKNSINRVKIRNQMLHPLTEEALNHYDK